MMSTMNMVTDMLRLKCVQNTLEKNQITMMDRINNYSPEHNIKNIYDELNISRLNELENIQKDTSSIWLPLQKLRSNLLISNIDDIDLDALKRQMNLIQINLKTLKQQISSHLRKLAAEETELTEEVSNYEKLVESFRSVSTNASHNFPNNAKHISYKTTSFAAPEIQEFIDFLGSSGGHENGWRIQDHQLFLKTRKKFKDVSAFVKAFHSLLPNIPEDDIFDHEKWYCAYVELRNKQKSAIEKWKQDKEIISDVSKNLCLSEDDIVCSNKRNGFSFEINPEVEEKLQMWKKEKEAKLQRERQIKKETEAKKLENEKIKQLRKLEIRECIQEWKNSKDAKFKNEKIEKELNMLKEKEMRSAQANKLLKQFRSNDDFYVQKMKKSMQSARNASNKSESNLCRAKKSAVRDPDRLLKPTKQWICRFMENRNAKADKRSLMKQNYCNVADIPKLGTPTWIQNKAVH